MEVSLVQDIRIEDPKALFSDDPLPISSQRASTSEQELFFDDVNVDTVVGLFQELTNCISMPVHVNKDFVDAEFTALPQPDCQHRNSPNGDQTLWCAKRNRTEACAFARSQKKGFHKRSAGL